MSARTYVLSMSVLWPLTVALILLAAALVWTGAFQRYDSLLAFTTVLLLALFVVDSAVLVEHYL